MWESIMVTIKTPKFYRQRFLLLLLEVSGRKLSKTDLQKLLFLSQKEANFSYYDFVPYHYGCYSFQAQSDLELMESFGWIAISEKSIKLLAKPKFFLKNNELQEIFEFSNKFKHLRGQKLIAYVYENYPYYATKSKIATKVLSKPSYEKVNVEKEKLRNDKDGVIFTIGYEGISFETYLNKLLKNNIKLLCDVRKNPLSRKFGFSKNSLNVILPKLGIKYLHFPDLGIRSELRQKLNTADDYQELFSRYKETLPNQIESLMLLENLFKEHKRIALTCFEKEHQFCHRHCVSDYLNENKNIRVCHI